MHSKSGPSPNFHQLTETETKTEITLALTYTLLSRVTTTVAIQTKSFTNVSLTFK